ncbi:MAG: hypothetical protein ACOCYB_05450 [Alkalispirochaeta sp.]
MIVVNYAARILTGTIVVFLLALCFGDVSSRWDERYRDALQGARDPIPVAQEMLLISGAIPVEPRRSDVPGAIEIMWTLVELRAERALLPQTWLDDDVSGGNTVSYDAELFSRIEEEFSRVDENITEFFEAIRIGAIPPDEAERFVEVLRELVADSNARIQDELRRRGESTTSPVVEMIEAFGTDRVSLELSDMGLSLPRYPSAEAFAIPPGRPEDDPGFRELPISTLHRYISGSNRLMTQLEGLEEAGYFDEVDPLRRSRVMRDHLRSLRRELYEEPTYARVTAWQDTVDRYISTVGEILTGNTQEALNPARDEYEELVTLREELMGELSGSFVILEDVAAPPAGEASQVFERATTANSILVGEHGRALRGWKRLVLLTVVGLGISIVLAPFRRGVVAALAPVALAIAPAVGAVLFIAGGIWVGPTALLMASGGAVGSGILVAGAVQHAAERALTGHGRDRLPARWTRRTHARGGLSRSDVGRRRAVIVVVAPDVRGEVPAVVLHSFHRAISRTITRHGGIVIGEDGLQVWAAFGARPPVDDTKLPRNIGVAVQKLVTEALPVGTPVRCGVEQGEVLFYVSPIGGYRATGPVVRVARRLSLLARKHHLRAVFGIDFVTAYGEEMSGNTARFEERGTLAVAATGDQRAFFTFTEIDRPSP